MPSAFPAMTSFLAQGGGGSSWALIAILVAVFLFVVVLPARKEKKQKEAMLKALKKGDKVILQCGLVAKVWQVKDDRVVIVEVDGTKMPFLRDTVSGLFQEKAAETAAPAAKS